MLFSRAYNGVSIASIGKASIVFAKAFPFLRLSPHSPSHCAVETTYFALLFLIRSSNMLYLEGDDTHCPTLALRQVFLSTLYHWLSGASDELFRILTGDRESLSSVLAAELLRSPFYLCVSLHIHTIISVEMYH